MTDEEIDALPTGLELDLAIEQSVMPGNLNIDQLDGSLRFLTRDLVPNYSSDMKAAWQVIVMIRGWKVSRRQLFLRQLIQEVSKTTGYPVPDDEFLWNMSPDHICRAALKTVEGTAGRADDLKAPEL